MKKLIFTSIALLSLMTAISIGAVSNLDKFLNDTEYWDVWGVGDTTVTTITILHTEDFESYSVADAMTDNGWTWDQYAAETSTYKVASGQVGEIVVTSGSWAGGYYITNGTGWTNYKVNFDITAHSSGRWIVGIRNDGSVSYWLQCLPNSALRLYRAESDFITDQTLIKDWDSEVPATTGDGEFQAQGANITLTIDSNLIGTHTDATYSAGSFAVSGYTTGWKIDNIIVTDL
jgi:hypothetical protein